MSAHWKFSSSDGNLAIDFQVATEGSAYITSGTLTCAGINYMVSGINSDAGSPSHPIAMFSVRGSNGLLAPNMVAATGVAYGQGPMPDHIAISVGVASSSTGLPLQYYTGKLYPTIIPNIQHVFVLMLENQSFDRLFGMQNLTGTDPSGNSTAINGLQPLPANFQNSYNNTPYQPKPRAVDPMTTDPGHEFPDTLQQLTGHNPNNNPFPIGPYPAINNSGFAANYALSHTEGNPPTDPTRFGDTACCCAQDQLPVLSTLAREFAICDNWFASVPGPTWPNRLFAMGASSGGMDRSPSFSDKIGFGRPGGGFIYPNGSFFDLLTRTQKPWRLYNDDTNAYAGVPPTTFGSMAIAYYLKGMKSYPHSLTKFGADLQGNYPYVFTWIEPNYGDAYDNTFDGGSSQHPTDGLRAGESLIHDVYNKIRNSPLWPNSLLIITYDEHGGFYDHVAPPTAPGPGDGAVGGNYSDYKFNFTNYGVRVPAVIVSPLIKQNTIDHTLYDHGTILRTVEDLLGLNPLTHRDALANTLLGLLTGPPRTDRVDTPAPAAPERVAVDAVPRDIDPTPRPEDAELLPERGNVWGFLQMAAKEDFELSGGTEPERLAIQTRLDSIKTKGDVRAYARHLHAKRMAFARKPAE